MRRSGPAADRNRVWRRNAGAARRFLEYANPKGPAMRQFILALTVAGTTTALAPANLAPARAQAAPDTTGGALQPEVAAADRFIDDRSSPAAVVVSLYNAISRHEYLRAHSYFRPDTAPDYERFKDGYARTDSVRLRVGETTSEGAAGSIHSTVPVAIEATDTEGATAVFTGCYRLTQLQPAAQDSPPFRPIQIDEGTLRNSADAFDSAMAECPAQ